MKLTYEVHLDEADIYRAVEKLVRAKANVAPADEVHVRIQWRARNAVVELKRAEVPTLTEAVTL